MCHMDQHWTETLPLALLGNCTAFKEDLQTSVAELVYSEPPKIPVELLAPPPYSLPETSSSRMLCLPGYIRAQRPREVYTHLPPPGHNMLGFAAPTRSCHGEKTLQILLCGRPITSTNRVKLAYLLTRLTGGPPPSSSPVIAPPDV
jgi:hypothetical protein